MSKKFLVYERYGGIKFVGEFEAATAEEAIEKASELDSEGVRLCWHCAGSIDLDPDPELIAEEA